MLIGSTVQTFEDTAGYGMLDSFLLRSNLVGIDENNHLLWHDWAVNLPSENFSGRNMNISVDNSFLASRFLASGLVSSGFVASGFVASGQWLCDQWPFGQWLCGLWPSGSGLLTRNRLT